MLDDAADAAAIVVAMTNDPANRENMLRSGFDHSGIGVAQADGKLVVVQLFARVEGELQLPLPAVLSSPADISAELATAAMAPIGWTLQTADGTTVARGAGTRLSRHRQDAVAGYLNIDVAVGPDVHSLRGPFVTLAAH